MRPSENQTNSVASEQNTQACVASSVSGVEPASSPTL